jgi:hypothetical protein
MLDARFVLVDGHRLEQTLTCTDGRAEIEKTVLILDDGLAFQTALDEHTTRLVPLLDGRRPLRAVLAQRAEELNLHPEDTQRYETAALPVVRRLLERGFLAMV